MTRKTITIYMRALTVGICACLIICFDHENSKIVIKVPEVHHKENSYNVYECCHSRHLFMRFEIWDLRFKIWDLRFEIWDYLRLEIWYLRFEVWDLRLFEICDMRFEMIWDLSFDIWDLKFEIWDDLRFETRDLRFEIIWDMRFETRDFRYGILHQNITQIYNLHKNNQKSTIKISCRKMSQSKHTINLKFQISNIKNQTSNINSQISNLNI